MSAVVCTLFENHYHYGLAGLTNSLYKNGFGGQIFAGYRGELPGWAVEAKTNAELNWTGAKTLTVGDDLQLHFLPVVTNFHLSIYKPYFMMDLVNRVARSATGIVYFDPDIVVKCKWEFYEKWVSYGVAVVHEIVSNDMPPNHPKRMIWKELIENSGRKVVKELHSYINSGFCGVAINDIDFIKAWIEVTDAAIKYYNFNPSTFLMDDRTVVFGCDQDGFNMAAMSTLSPISEMGPEAMDFLYGGYTMSHALGSPKPWKKNFFRSAFSAKSPTQAEKAYWLYVKYPIRCFSDYEIRIKQLSINFASFIGRFYGRN